MPHTPRKKKDSFSSRSIKSIGQKELLICVVLCLVMQLSFLNYGHFIFMADGQLRWVSLLLSLVPGFGVLLFIAIFVRPLISLATVTFMLSAVNIANDKKNSLVGEPVCWNDIHAINNLEIIVKYLDLRTGLFFLAAVFFLIFCFLKLKAKRQTKKERLFILAGSVSLLLLSSVPYFGATGNNFSEYVSYKLQAYDARYVYWDWKQNVLLNGLPQHLLQTSRRLMPDMPSNEEKDQFERLSSEPKGVHLRPRKILFILCEACWHDDKNFHALFEPLKEKGFRQVRAVSPVYGGSTVNASFEILTGLPSNNVLSGVIYQEYASFISERALTLPRYLKREGYKTVAIHNYYKKFWNRQKIMPKFGFDTFIGLEDMEYTGHDAVPSDALAFDAAYKQLLLAGEDPVFMFITTVYTHGPYLEKNDLGEGDYRSRLGKTLEQFREFSDKVTRAYPDALIILAGDHKPGLTRYLLAQGVFKRDDFERVGTRDDSFLFSDRQSLDSRGDVPIYIRHSDEQRLDAFIRQADAKPFYCFSQLLNDDYTGVQLPAYNFSRTLCKNSEEPQLPLQEHRKQYPGWLYYLSLFE